MITSESGISFEDEDQHTAPDAGGGAVSPADVSRFAAMFPGYSKAHGQYDLSPGKLKLEDSGKIKGKATTERGGATIEMYEAHLKGEMGLGVILLRDDDSVMFGAIDYDNRNTDHVKAEQAVKRLGLPLLVCRSKSGGAHFYCFLSRPMAAATMRERLSEWVAMLGLAATTEQFPKQSTRFNDNDIGSWINLPYFNLGAGARNPSRTIADATRSYCLSEGQPLSLSQFLDAAEAHCVDPETLEQSTAATMPQKGVLFEEGPPCLQMIHAQGGFMEGGRNNGMQAVMVYLKKRYPDDWQSHVDEYNTEMAGLPSAEVQGIVKHNSKAKQYNYSCKLAPINAHCQRKICLGRQYGVGDGNPEAKGYDLTALTRYDAAPTDEPMWGLEVNGKRVMVSNSQLYSRDDFNRAAMAQANVLPIHMAPQRWLRYLSEVIQTADVVQMPDDAGPTGQLWQWVESFCLNSPNALTREEVWLGKPYREDGRVYFRSHDLFRYFEARRVKYKTEQAVWQLLRDRGGDKTFWHLKGKGVNVWHLPMPETPQLDEDVGLEVEELEFKVSEDF